MRQRNARISSRDETYQKKLHCGSGAGNSHPAAIGVAAIHQGKRYAEGPPPLFVVNIAGRATIKLYLITTKKFLRLQTLLHGN